MLNETKQHLTEIAPLLGGYYLACALPGILFVLNNMKRGNGRDRLSIRPEVVLGVGPAIGFLVLSACSIFGFPPLLPESVKHAVDAVLGPVTLFFTTLALLLVVYFGRHWATRPWVGLISLDFALLLLGLAMTDREFAAQVGRPDNLPIIVMFFLLAGFTWWALSQAVENDRRLKEGRAPVESQYAWRVSTWPEVVYLELIGMLIATTLLIVWSIVLKAPLEEPADPALTPNPAKAPWYFLGLQELLVYFDPWMAGVVLPVLIIIGLCAIPYLDTNPRGNGFFTVRNRPMAVPLFFFGFFMLWMLPIFIGTFLRGPNWSFFGPFSIRDAGVLPDYENVKLSEWFWRYLLGRTASIDGENAGSTATVLLRESPGIVLLSLYYFLLPLLLLRTRWRTVHREMGTFGYVAFMFLLLTMFLIPLKMLFRWVFDVSYLVSIPIWNFNL